MADAERTPTPAAEVGRRYFAAVADADLDAMVACWAPGGVDRLVGQADLIAPEGVREWFTELFAAIPDWRFETVEEVFDDERYAARWRATGTFAGPGTLQGFEANGARLDFEGCDVLVVRDGLVQSNSAFADGVSLVRQIGALPESGSAAERHMASAFNARTKLQSKMAGTGVEAIADGVWIVRGGFPQRLMNVFLIADDGGVTVFDTGIRQMTPAIAQAGASLGGIRRIVLGSSHADHRGGAPGLNAPVYCHPKEADDARGDGGAHYFDISKLEHSWARVALPRLMRSWDGGPVEVAGTVDEGDEIAGFRVVHLPGHAPGLIGLHRESDALALVSDAVYTFDPQTGRKGPARVPHPAYNFDTGAARASMLKLAEMTPATVWPGHADALVGDVRTQLVQAAGA